jgi:tetratricopeptide (TPR) repeat protein
MALMSKPQVITFPFLLLLWDYWPLRRLKRHGETIAPTEHEEMPQHSVAWLALEKVPLILLSLADAVVTIIAQRAGHALRTASEYSLLNRVENALISYVRYLGMAFWPSKLAAFYPHPTKLFPVWQVAGAVILLLAVTAMAVLQRRERPYVIVGWLWFVGAMIPMIGLVQVGGHALADRFAYIPFIGLFLIVVWQVADWACFHKISRIWIIVPTTIVLVALAAMTHRQIGFWRDTPTMWTRALAVTENNFVAHDNLAIFLAQRGHEDEAVVHLRAALAIWPDDLLATLNLGTYEHGHGDLNSAIGHYQKVALHAADIDMRSNAYSNLGSAFRQLGDDADAKHCFEEALKLTPGRPIALVGLGLIAEHAGDFAEATRQFANAMAVQPTDVGYLLLAHALDQAGRSADAQAARQRAAQISPDLGEAQKQANGLLGRK